jgi:hypothetical protein
LAITYVGSAGAGSAAGTTTQTVTYSPTPGNIVIIFFAPIGTSGAITVKDSSTNSLTPGPTAGVGSSFYYIAQAGITSFTATWVTSRSNNMVVLEYSGVTGGVNAALAGNTATGSGAAQTISVTTQDANDFIVGGVFSGASTVTLTVGNSRIQETLGTNRLTAGDNTSASPGVVTMSGTSTSGTWGFMVIELRLALVAGGTSFVSCDYVWGGGDN